MADAPPKRSWYRLHWQTILFFFLLSLAASPLFYECLRWLAFIRERESGGSSGNTWILHALMIGMGTGVLVATVVFEFLLRKLRFIRYRLVTLLCGMLMASWLLFENMQPTMFLECMPSGDRMSVIVWRSGLPINYARTSTSYPVAKYRGPNMYLRGEFSGHAGWGVHEGFITMGVNAVAGLLLICGAMVLLEYLFHLSERRGWLKATVVPLLNLHISALAVMLLAVAFLLRANMMLEYSPDMVRYLDALGNDPTLERPSGSPSHFSGWPMVMKEHIFIGFTERSSWRLGAVLVNILVGLGLVSGFAVLVEFLRRRSSPNTTEDHRNS